MTPVASMAFSAVLQLGFTGGAWLEPSQPAAVIPVQQDQLVAPAAPAAPAITSVSVVRLSGVVQDPNMTALDNLTTSGQQDIVALRNLVASNPAVRNALAQAGVTDINAIVGMQARGDGALTVYVR